jgi:transposase-like protein
MQEGSKMSVLNGRHFKDEVAAYAFVEARVWPQGRVCPHCGVVEKSGPLKGKSTRVGVYKCYACRKPFTVKVGTIFESSHIPLHIWLQAMHLLCSSKKGMSANQLHRILGVTLKSAWFMAHRIREAMGDDKPGAFGSGGGAVESDETFLTRKRRKGDGPLHKQPKMKVLTLIDRDTKQARSTVIENLRPGTLWHVISKNVSRDARLMTDEARHYQFIGRQFADHQTVNHGREEYVRGDAYTNTAEGFFSIFKKGMKAVYQHCEEKHLDRYLNEFDFRYTNRVATGVNDEARTARTLDGVVGKRLMYRDLIQ